MKKNTIKLVEKGIRMCNVVYPKDASPIIINALDMLIEAIYKETGAVMWCRKSDALAEGAAHDPNEKAILIGKTNYDETQEVLASLQPLEYKIAVVGNKLVIAAWDDVQVQAAVNHYITDLIKNNIEIEENAKTLYADEYHFVPEKFSRSAVTVNGTDITRFSIVYPQSDQEYRTIGEILQKIVLNATGTELSLYSDDEEERTNEIHLGKTNRDFSQKLYNNTKKYIMTYSIEVYGGKMQILSGGCFSALRCVTDMMSIFSPKSEGFDFADGSHRKTELMSNPTELAEGADVRIMTSNLLHHDWADGRMDVVYRAEVFAGVLRDYHPDAAGLQELMRDRWQDELVKWLDVLREDYGIEYSLSNNIFHYKHHTSNPTSLLYRSDLYDCVDEEYILFPHWSPSQGISVPMCHVRSKSDSSKEFILMNTHWDVDCWGGARKDICCDESAAFVNKWKSVGCPIFFTGDWNALRDRDCVKNFMAKTGVQTAETDYYCIEFTFYYGENVTVKNKKILEQYMQMSDHSSRYTDFTIR